MITIIGLIFLASIFAWQVKEKEVVGATISIFLIGFVIGVTYLGPSL